MSQQRKSTVCEFLILQYAGPAKPVCNVGILLWHPRTLHLYWRITESWDRLADAEDVEVLSLLSAEFAERVREMGPEAFLRYLEDTLSNVLRVTDRQQLESVDVGHTLDALYAKYVASHG